MKRAILIAAIVLMGVASLFIGVKDVTVAGLLTMQPEQLYILGISRLPRLLSVLVAGMSMSVAGVIMQLIVSNRFISPTTGSTIEWSKLGVLTAILLFPSASPIVKMLIALAFSFVGTLIFVQLLQRIKLKDAALVPLVGILFGNVVSALTTFVAYNNDLMQNITSWLQGSFTMVLRGRYELLYVGIPFLLLAMVYANRFTVVSMGKDVSSNLGVGYKATVQVGLLIISVITSVVVVTVGSIPFVGVVIPNIVRMYRGDHLEKSIIDIALMGGGFLLACDIVSRLILFPFEIPIGVTVGVIGCGLFVAMLAGRRAYEAS